MPFVSRIDRVEFGSGARGFGARRPARDGRHLGVGLVDDHRPRAVRVPVGRGPRRPVDRPDLRLAVGGHRGGVEGGVLDVVAHAADVVLAHRLDVEQRAAVVEVELAVPAVVHGVAEVHELRRRADVELQALEDRDDVDALVVSAPSASAWCRSGWTPIHSSMAICSISSRPKLLMHQAIPDRSISWPISSSSGTSVASSSRDSAAYLLVIETLPPECIFTAALTLAFLSSPCPSPPPSCACFATLVTAPSSLEPSGKPR